jgi:hypothetical protein
MSSSNSNTGSRPGPELALGLRSHERIAVVSDGDPGDYDDSWVYLGHGDFGSYQLPEDSLVLVDRVEPTVGLISVIGCYGPRILAMAPRNVEQEKSMRRMLSALYPWSELWTVSTSFGKLLVTKDAVGPTYDRSAVFVRA